MRTTIDLPDPLFRRVKATAAARGLKLKDLVITALEAAIRNPEPEKTEILDVREKHRRLMRDHFQRMDEGRSVHEPVGRIQRDALHDRHA
jgi:hypothetical protein